MHGAHAAVIVFLHDEVSVIHQSMNEVSKMPLSPEPFPESEYAAETAACAPRHNRLPPDYLRRIARVEALPGNASGSDKTWVHRAHADAVRHLEAAKRH